MRYVLVLFAVGCALVGTSCKPAPAPPPPGPAKGWSFVATVGGLDGITQIHLHSLLAAHAVDCLMEGSVVYGVSVPTDKYSEALRLIQEDLRQRKYDITLYTGAGDLKFSVPDADWKSTEPKVTCADLLSRGDYAPSTDLGGLLRTREVQNEALAFPYVMRIESLERSYLDSQQIAQVGHEVVIELAVKPDEEIAGHRLRFQVWDSGKQIRSFGGSERWRGTPDEVARNKQQYDKRKAAETAH